MNHRDFHNPSALSLNYFTGLTFLKIFQKSWKSSLTNNIQKLTESFLTEIEESVILYP